MLGGGAREGRARPLGPLPHNGGRNGGGRVVRLRPGVTLGSATVRKWSGAGGRSAQRRARSRPRVPAPGLGSTSGRTSRPWTRPVGARPASRGSCPACWSGSAGRRASCCSSGSVVAPRWASVSGGRAWACRGRCGLHGAGRTRRAGGAEP